jgi:hypothetical protein
MMHFIADMGKGYRVIDNSSRNMPIVDANYPS